MRPPICDLCGKDFRSRWLNLQQGGEIVQFSDYAPNPPISVGHPRGAMWFCDEHKEEAKQRTSLTSHDALAELREKYSIAPSSQPSDYGLVPDPQLWMLNPGSNLAKVVAILKEATGLSTEEARDIIKGKPFRIKEGSFAELESYQIRLDEIGAKAGIFFNDQNIPK